MKESDHGSRDYRMMRIWDISLAVSPELSVWPGDPPIVLERYMAISKGDAVNISRFACSVHIGTHVDAPVHFVEGGSAVEELPLNVLIGPAVMAELPDVDAITPDYLEALTLPSDMTRCCSRQVIHNCGLALITSSALTMWP